MDEFPAFVPFVNDPGRAGVFSDFDGTLSAIVDDPGAATPWPGVVDAISDLTATFGVVGVLSGRPLGFIAPFFANEVMLAGLYGLETRINGTQHDHPLSGAWREVIDDVASAAQAIAPPGMRVESKGLSLTLHYRGAPEIAGEVQAWAQAQAARSGLEVRPAKMSFELHPPIAIDKGSTLLGWIDGLKAVCFIGDDVGDLAAFDALDVMSAGGVVTVRVVARSDEVNPELVERADVVVDGPEGVLTLLEHLGTTATSR